MVFVTSLMSVVFFALGLSRSFNEILFTEEKQG